METRNIRDHDIITLMNIDKEDFTFEYDKVAGNPPYTVKSGEVKRFPRYIARHAVKHLIDRILIKKEIRVNNQIARDDLAKQIVVDEEVFSQQHQETESERLQKEIEKLNSPSDLELVLARSRATEKASEPPKPKETVGEKPHMEEKTKEEKFDQLEEEKAQPKQEEKGVLKELDLDEDVEKDEELKVDNKDTSDEIKLPTKEALKEFATGKMGLTWDDKLQKTFKQLSVKELVKTLQYPVEDLL